MRRVLLILWVGMLLVSNLLHLSVTVSDSTASTQSLALVVTATSSPFLPAIEPVPTHDILSWFDT